MKFIHILLLIIVMKIRNDGINYWKGKKIISTKEWNELYEKSSTYTDTYTTTTNI